jgi:DNA-binding NtrC family response regulator
MCREYNSTKTTVAVSGGNAMQVNTNADSRPLDEVLATIEKREILSALQRADGQRTLAARLLGISRSRLYRRMEALGIDPRTSEFRVRD